MNLLEKANTITTPTAYSDGFLHSVKPEVVENLLLQSNAFDTTWNVDTGVTLTSGQSGYDGSNDAWKMDKDASQFRAIRQTPTYFGVVTFSVYAKEGTLRYLNFYNPNTTAQTWFDLQTGSLGTQTGSYIENKIEDVGGGWYRCSVSMNASSGGEVRLYPSSSSSSYTAVAGNIYIQDAQLNKGATAYPYLETTTEAIPSADFTFTRNSSATRVNELGYIEDVQIIGGELVSNGDFEEIGSELVTNGSFDDGGTNWTYGGLVTFADGKASFVDNGTNTYSFIAQTVFTASKTYKIEVNISRLDGGQVEVLASGGTIGLFSDSGIKTIYHTASAGDILIKRYSAAPNFDFDIDNISVKEVGQDWTFFGDVTMGDGLVSFVSPTTTYSYIRQDIGSLSASNYRISIEVKNYVSGAVQAAFFGASTTVQNFNVTGDGVYTVELSPNANGDDLEISREFSGGAFDFDIDNISVKEVTDDTNLPRINYEGFTYENGLPVPYSGKGHLLLESQRTNSILYSENFGTTYWSKYQCTILDNQGISPEGLNNAARITSTASGNCVIYKTSVVCGSLSMFAKPDNIGGGTILISVDGVGAARWNADGTLNLVSGGTAVNGEDYGNGWFRFTFNVTSGSVANYGLTASTGENILIYGVQNEPSSSYPTSYIPTNGTAVTRLGETCNNATHSFPSEGVLYAEIAATDDTAGRWISLSDGTLNERINVANQSGNLRIFIRNTTGVILDVSIYPPNGYDDIFDFNKIALRYKSGDYAFYVNGTQVVTSAATSLASNISSLQFDLGDGSGNFYGKTKMVATFPYLSNDEMECLTGEGYGTFEALAAAYSYTIK